jgi:hypothetical protein
MIIKRINDTMWKFYLVTEEMTRTESFSKANFTSYVASINMLGDVPHIATRDGIDQFVICGIYEEKF